VKNIEKSKKRSSGDSKIATLKWLTFLGIVIQNPENKNNGKALLEDEGMILKIARTV